jgi:hypothetical protein
MTTINDLLPFAGTQLSIELGGKLATTDLGKTADEILQLKPFELANLLAEKGVSSSKQVALADAASLQGFLRTCFGEESPTQAVNAGPTAVAFSMPAPQVTVNIPKDFDQMTLTEALDHVNSNRVDMGMQFTFLARPDVVQAVKVAGTEAIFVSTTPNSVDSTAGSNFISALLGGDPYKQTYCGSFLLTLGMTLGTTLFQFKHPFDGSKLGSTKIDSLGLDFSVSTFTSEKFEAFVWMQGNSNTIPPNFKAEIAKSSAFVLYQDVITDGFITQGVLLAFRHAKNTLRDPNALSVDVIYRSDKPAVIVGKVPLEPPTAQEKTYEDRVREFAKANIIVKNYGKTYRREITSTLRVDAYDTTLSEVIVLDRCTIDAYNVNGTVYTPIGLEIAENSYGIEINQIQLTWERLLDKCVEWRGNLR